MAAPAAAPAMPSILGPIAASAVGNVVSGLFGGKQDNYSRKDHVAQLQFQHHFNLLDAEKRPWHMVKGARLAGIHPALLFGGSAMSAPSWTMGPTGDSRPGGGFLSNMGQDISRAMMAKMSADERAKELEAAQARQKIMDEMALERHRAEVGHINMQNQLLASQIKRLETQATPPAPSNTSGVQTYAYDSSRQTPKQTGKFLMEPAKVTSADPKIQSLEAGPPSPGFKRFRIGGPTIGGTIELPGQGMAESLESMGPIAAPAYVWGHNMFRPLDRLIAGGEKPSVKLPPGYVWKFNPLTQRWRAANTRARPSKLWRTL